MRFFVNNHTDPAFNLALEELLASDYDQDLFMLWRNAPSIIVGRNQHTAAEVNAEFVKSRDIRVVRRITGGGAVYHDLGNVNYTLAVADRQLDSGAFARYAQPVVEALRTLGAAAEFSGRNDILVEGRKVSGSAKSVLRERTLFHGTLLFDVDLGVLGDALRPDEAKIRSKGIKSVRSRVVNLREFMPGWTTDDFLRELEKQLLKQFGLTGVSELPPELLERAGELACRKYRSWEWNYGTPLAYEFVKSARFTGGSVKVELNAERNRIASLRLSGDFFGRRPVEELAAALIGTELNPAELRKALDRLPVDEYIQGVSAGELAGLFE